MRTCNLQSIVGHHAVSGNRLPDVPVILALAINVHNARPDRRHLASICYVDHVWVGLQLIRSQVWYDAPGGCRNRMRLLGTSVRLEIVKQFAGVRIIRT